MKRLPILLFILISINSFSLNLNAESAILISHETGTVLYEKNADKLVSPASMTKLVSIYTALTTLKDTELNLDSKITIKANADFRNMPPRSSLMFLQEGQIVTVNELLTGLSIASGNDAAVAIADICTGSMDSFVAEMNKSMQRLGFDKCHFVETSGYSSLNKITVRQFSKFCSIMIKEFPEILEYTSIASYTYPKPRNLNYTTAVYGAITQYNHNELIGKIDYVDGLKTGYIDESGNNVSITANKDGFRIVAVLAGIHASDKYLRSNLRYRDGVEILNYAYDNYRDVQISSPRVENIRIKNGTQKYTSSSPKKITKTMLKKYEDHIIKEYQLFDNIEAPLAEDSVIGTWTYTVGNKKPVELPLYSGVKVERGNFFQRLLN